MIRTELARPGVSWLGRTLLMVLVLIGQAELGRVRAEDKSVPSGSTISGTITDGAKAPQSGTRVTLYRWMSVIKPEGMLEKQGETLTSDAQGNYQFGQLADGSFRLLIEAPGCGRVFRDVLIEEQQPQQVALMLKPAAAVKIRVVDAAGKPISAARIREYRTRGDNGECRFPQLTHQALGINLAPSNQQGEITVPELAVGDHLHGIIIDHADFAAVKIDEVPVTKEAMITTAMKPGVPVKLQLVSDDPAARPKVTAIDLRHDPFTHPSTILQTQIQFDEHGTARLNLEPGPYSWLWLQHTRFHVTPVYAANYKAKRFLNIGPGRNQQLQFEVRHKVAARGRIIDAVTGKPLKDMSVKGELRNNLSQGWDDAPDAWSFAQYADSDEQGNYTIQLAAGSARISFEGDGYLPEQDFYEVTVAADGSTVLPEIKAYPLQKIVGHVQNPDGTPAAGMVVRLRGRYMTRIAGVLTDAAGRFELQPDYVPVDEDTNTRVRVQPVVAFDPYSPLAAKTTVRLDRPEELVLKLEPHEPDWPLNIATDEKTDWQLGKPTIEQAERYAQISLRDKAPPELDVAAWLNTGGRSLNLQELRGKYVLLDFWFTGCGPCHGDFPSVKLVHELYQDRGVVVIGVHNNSATPDAVKAHVEKIGLPFPIAVDHPDGRCVARFEPHGIPDGYPDYVLISPEGKVLFDDRTIPAPMLRSFKLEIIRSLLLKSPARGK